MDQIKSRIAGWFSNQSKELICEMQILTAIVFFSASFICQKQAMLDGIKPITYNFCRYFISTVSLYIIHTYSGVHLHAVESEDEIEGVIASTVDDLNYMHVEDSDAKNKIDLESLPTWNSQETDRFLPNEDSAPPNDVPSTFFFGFISLTTQLQVILSAGLIGFTYFGGSLFQQMGLVTVTAGKTAFITGMYVIFVPMIEYALIPKYRENMNIISVIAVLLSLIGLYLLSGCAEDAVCFGSAIREGEVFVFISMLFWAFSILLSDFAVKSENIEVLALTFYEFCFATFLTLLVAIYYESDELQYPWINIRRNALWIILVGVIDALAYAMYTFGQRYISPTRVAILFAFDSVLCAIGSYFLLGEKLTTIEIVGACCMTTATLATKIPFGNLFGGGGGGEGEGSGEGGGGGGGGSGRERARTRSEDFLVITTQYYQHNNVIVCDEDEQANNKSMKSGKSNKSSYNR
jgi:drug/metabolite transporter (DMT)-like permease